MDPTLRHFSITSLALFAKRENLVHASVSTWHRVARHYKLRRPGHRRYPLKPKVGIRASAPGQILHLDQTVIKLKDGTRCFIQSVLDNFSRYVLAWQITRSYGGVSTKALILSALQKARSFGIAMAPQVIADGGSENLNKHVDALVDEGVVTRTIAQVEVDYSNSMIEALFLRLKHRHLFFQELTSFEKLMEHTDFYLKEVNERIPMASLGGATPLEIISGSWSKQKQAELRELAATARKHRIITNLALQCEVC